VSRPTEATPAGSVSPRTAPPAGTGAAPYACFGVSAVFHYFGPGLAVLLFAHVAPLGVAWLRIATAAAVFVLWRNPFRYFRSLAPATRRAVLLLGVVLALMNVSFYLAIARLPLATVGAVEFLGPIVLAAAGVRSARNLAALLLAVAGVYLLMKVRFAGAPLGLMFAAANCVLFVLYIVLGHRIAADGGAAGIDRLAAAMLAAAIVAFPIGIREALPAFASLVLLTQAVAVGICSSVIPYVADQLVMARVSRATFSLLLSLLPAVATVIGAVMLHQFLSLVELCGVVLVAGGIFLHRNSS
jgi:inner membrane transporter RhtA